MNNILVNGAMGHHRERFYLGLFRLSYWGVWVIFMVCWGIFVFRVIVTYCNVTNSMYSKLSYQDSRLTYIENTTRLDFQNVSKGNNYIRIAAQQFQGISLENKDLEFVDSGVFLK